jgi:hypothetical protein
VGEVVSVIRSVPVEGCTIRFLTEPEDWVGFYEVFDARTRRWLPQLEDDPQDAPSVFGYLAEVLWRDEHGDTACVVRLDWRLGNELIELADDLGSLCDRDLTLAVDMTGEHPVYVVRRHRKTRRPAGSGSGVDLVGELVKARGRREVVASEDADGFDGLVLGWLSDSVAALNELDESTKRRHLVVDVSHLRRLLRDAGLPRSTIDTVIRRLDRARPSTTASPFSCPRCGAAPRPVLFGMPTPALAAFAEGGLIELGGCIPDDIRYVCRSCGLTYDETWARLPAP